MQMKVIFLRTSLLLSILLAASCSRETEPNYIQIYTDVESVYLEQALINHSGDNGNLELAIREKEGQTVYSNSTGEGQEYFRQLSEKNGDTSFNQERRGGITKPHCYAQNIVRIKITDGSGNEIENATFEYYTFSDYVESGYSASVREFNNHLVNLSNAPFRMISAEYELVGQYDYGYLLFEVPESDIQLPVLLELNLDDGRVLSAKWPL